MAVRLVHSFAGRLSARCVMVGFELHMYLQGNSREVYQYVFGFGGAFGRLWRQRWRWRDGDGDGGADDERRRRRR